MRLWPLQLVIIALAFLVGWGLVSVPSVRNTPKLQQMCAALKPGADPDGDKFCAELKRQS